VIRVPLEERLHVLRRDQTDIAADRCQLPTDVMRARAGLHADQAMRNIGETAFKLTAGHLLLQNDRTPLVETDEMERVLADVDTDRGDNSTAFRDVRIACSLSLASRLPATVQQLSR